MSNITKVVNVIVRSRDETTERKNKLVRSAGDCGSSDSSCSIGSGGVSSRC